MDDNAGLQTPIFKPRMRLCTPHFRAENGVCKPLFSSQEWGFANPNFRAENRVPPAPPPPRAGITILKDLGLENAKLVIPARAPSPPHRAGITILEDLGIENAKMVILARVSRAFAAARGNHHFGGFGP